MREDSGTSLPNVFSFNMNAVKVVPPSSQDGRMGGYIEINNGTGRDSGKFGPGPAKQSISIINSNIYGMEFHQDGRPKKHSKMWPSSDDQIGKSLMKPQRNVSSSQLNS